MRLLIIRNPQSPLLHQLDLDRKDQKIVLVQNGVYAEELRNKGAAVLDEDARARKMESANTVNYGQLLDAVLAADRTICT